MPLAEIARTTRVAQRYLESLEADDHSKLPAPVFTRGYVRAYGVDLAEAAEPLEAFATFNEFFTRRLREGARVVDPEPGAVVSPSDSRVNAIGISMCADRGALRHGAAG